MKDETPENQISRRSFLFGSAAGAASLAGIGILGGCSPSAPTTADTGEETFVETVSLDDAQYDVDVVVLGSGASGMSAAIEAKAQGGNVLLVEVSDKLGGTTQFAEGILGVNTPAMQAQGLKGDIIEMMSEELEFSNYVADPGLLKDFLEAADEDIAWLEGMGVEFQPTVIRGVQHTYVGLGASMIASLETYAKSMGLEILTSTRGKRLFMEDGKVTGLVVEDETGEYAIKTKTVILACGGYIQNSDMMGELLRFDPNRVKVSAAPNHMGDSQTMAYAAGGDQTGVTLLQFIRGALRNIENKTHIYVAFCGEPGFYVNQDGERFVKEDLVRKAPIICNPIFNQKRAFSILSQNTVDRLMTKGADFNSWGTFVVTGDLLTDLQDELDDAIAKGVEEFYYAETIDELAAALDIDPSKLNETITNYNAMVAAGADTELGKAPEYLYEISADGPFYAAELMANAMCTMGGIRVNRRNEVLEQTFAPIPGLYCAGVDCSGLQGTTYNITLAGAAQGYAVYSGRNSAKNAVAYAQA